MFPVDPKDAGSHEFLDNLEIRQAIFISNIPSNESNTIQIQKLTLN